MFIIEGRKFPFERARSRPKRFGDSFLAGRKTPGGETGLSVGGKVNRAPLVGRLGC
jgi:hypothetical protein